MSFKKEVEMEYSLSQDPKRQEQLAAEYRAHRRAEDLAKLKKEILRSARGGHKYILVEIDLDTKNLGDPDTLSKALDGLKVVEHKNQGKFYYTDLSTHHYIISWE